MTANDAAQWTDSPTIRRYNAFLLLVAGLGGLLYGIDVGIIGGALPYLEATSKLTPAELSVIVAAVLLGSVFSTLFAGVLADWMGRKPLMILSGLTFVISIPVIALSQGYGPLFLGRLLQGISGGLIGVVVPLYLAECLSASNRGKGTAVFQWMLTLGIVAAALVGIYYSYRVEAVAKAADAATLFNFKDQAWRRIFWVSMPPGALFVLGSLFVTESPRWLFRHTTEARAHAALLRSRSPEQAAVEIEEMAAVAHTAEKKLGQKIGDSLLQRKYVIPFLLACVILACNTATGVNSLIGYNTSILLQSGLSDLHAHWGYVVFTAMNFLMTTVGMVLVDRKGRRFLFILGTSGIVVPYSTAAWVASVVQAIDVAWAPCFCTPKKWASIHASWFNKWLGRARNSLCTSIGLKQATCSPLLDTRAAISRAIVLRWPSFTLTGISPRQPVLYVPTIRRHCRFKSRAKPAFPQTRLRLYSRIPSPISRPRRPLH